jgi:hypothetical protein
MNFSVVDLNLEFYETQIFYAYPANCVFVFGELNFNFSSSIKSRSAKEIVNNIYLFYSKKKKNQIATEFEFQRMISLLGQLSISIIDVSIIL